MATDAATRPRRVILAALAVATIAAGLVVHARVDGAIGDIAGDALYAVLIYLITALALPRTRRPVVALVAIAACTAVEVLQLTGIPGALSESFPPAALVLGSGFDARDLLVYAVAAVVASVADALASRLARRGGTPEGALPKESAL